MDRKSVLYFGCSIAALALTVGACLTSNANYNSFAVIKAEADNITVSDGNEFLEGSIDDGSFYMRTANGNKIKFESEGVTISDGDLVFSAGGYILNPYFEADGTDGIYGDNAISGMTGILITHDGEQGDIAVDYTWGESLTGSAPYYQRRGYVFPKTQSYGFLSENPNYICIRAVKNVTVSKISLNYSCNRGEEKGENLKIDSASMLERFKTTVNWGNSYEGQTVELTADLDMTTLVKDNAQMPLVPIGEANAKPFKGTFEGHNHTISNLLIASGASYRGLFGNAVDATIRNLTIDNISVTATSQYNGGLIGAGSGVWVENVTIESGTINSKQGTGGIIGFIDDRGTRETYISNCINKADITKTASSQFALFGGIFGETNSAKQKVIVVGCKNYGSISGNLATSANNGMVGGIGGLVRVVNTGSMEVSHCANFGNVVSNNGSVGGIVGRARTGTYKDNYCYAGATIDNNGAITSNMLGTSSTSPAYAGRIIGITENTPTISIYDNCDQDGASINATSISTLAELKAARTTINSASSSGSFYKLENDIDASGANFGGGIGNVSYPFAGVFDGCGHTISGLTDSVATQSGLFKSAEGSVIKNINLSDAGLTSTGNRGAAVIGRAKGSMIYNCHVLSGTVASKTGETGGIAGIGLDGTIIRSCSNEASVSAGDAFVGGILGYAYSNEVEIDHCENNGDVSSSKAYDANGAKVGGILGGTYIGASSIQVTIHGCVNNGAISSANRATGGIVGQVASNSSAKTHRILNCVNNGSVTSTAATGQAIGTGGIVGALGKLDAGTDAPSNGYVYNCVNKGTVQSGGGSIGGIAGVAFAYSASSTAKIIDCVNFGSVTSTYSTNNASAPGTGGILGASNDNNGSYSILIIDNCVNLGAVSGSQYVGGVVGILRKSYAGSAVKNCINYGDVTGVGSSTAGVAGVARRDVLNCGCYEGATLTMGSTSKLASQLNAIGGGASTLGYVTTEVQPGASVTGSFLVKQYFDYKSAEGLGVSPNPVTNETLGSFTSFAANGKSVHAAYSWPSLKKLHNGKYLLTATSGYAVGDSISENAFTNWKTRNNSYGQDYVRDPSTHEDTELEARSANFSPLVLPNGRVIIFYRTNPINNDDYRYSSLRAIVSDDNCETWTKYVLFENYGSSDLGGGAYEPFGVVKGDKIYVYFAMDIESSHYNGYGNDYSNFICSKDSAGMLYQNIMYFTIDIANNSFEVNDDVAVAIQAAASYRRPGMPSVVRLNDGTYAMVVEHCGSIASMSDYWMQIAISYSRDLVNWTVPKNIITPTQKGIKDAAEDQYYLAGAPTIKLLPSGRIAVSYTTNEYYHGIEACNSSSPVDNQWFRTVELAVSDGIVTYGSTPSMTRLTNVRSYGENCCANYGRCEVIDNKLILMSNNAAISLNEKGVAERKSATGIYLSISKLALDY